jgi:hypothetical protein
MSTGIWNNTAASATATNLMGLVIPGEAGEYAVHDGKMQAPAVSLSLADGHLAGQFVQATGAGVHHLHDAKHDAGADRVVRMAVAQILTERAKRVG